jgi:FkbM family methyltransferase
MTLSCTFSNESVEILLPEHPYAYEFAQRDCHEVVFRRLNRFLIDRRIIKNNVVDAGCWVGDNAVPWAKVIEGRVYAIDPSPSNCLFVTAVKELNRLSNLVVIQAALGESRGTVSTDEDLHHCKLESNDRGRNRVGTTSIDLLSQEGVVRDLGYIHLDVEGMEAEAIRGALRVIHEFRPVLTFEQHLDSDDYMALVGVLKTRGYAAFLIDEILPGCRPDCRNLLALPVEAHVPGFESDVDSYLGTKGALIKI